MASGCVAGTFILGRMMKKLLLSIFAMGAMQNALGAIPEITPPEPMKTKLGFMLNQLKNVHYFAGPTGWVGIAAKQPNGQSLLMYVDASGRYLMTGLVVDLDERPPKNITLEASSQFLAGTTLGGMASDALKAQNQAIDERVQQRKAPREYTFKAAALQSLPYVETGSGPVLVYGFVDMTCSACRASIRELTLFQASAAKGRLRIRWIPTSNGHELATALAAQVLGASDREKMLKLLAAEGKQNVDKASAAKGAIALERVMAFTSENKINTTPLFVLVNGDKTTIEEGYRGLGFFAR